jgi:hypothetical protein
MKLTCVEINLKGKDPLIARVLHSVEHILFQPLHARSRLFMATLMC